MKQTTKILTIILSVCILAATLPALSGAAGGNVYAVFNSTDKTLTFCVGTQEADGVHRDAGGTVAGDAYYSNFENTNYSEETPWYTHCSAITTVVFLDEIKPTYTSHWFTDFEKLTEITGIENLNTENVTDMSCMFLRCESLETIDLHTFDTARVENFMSMFALCSSLKEVNLSGFSTGRSESFRAMFGLCPALESLDLSDFSVKEGAEMNLMFVFDTALSSIKFGPGFRFTFCELDTDDKDDWEALGLDVTGAGLPDAPQDADHTGYWIKENGSGTQFTADQLMHSYNGESMSGTWKWETNTPAVDLSDAKVTAENVTYTGEAAQPHTTVKKNNTELTENVDYTVQFANNAEIGTAVIIVTGINGYTGTAYGTFRILDPSSVSGAEVTVDALSVIDETTEPDVTVLLNGTRLTKDTDYTVAYHFNAEESIVTITVTGIGEFNDTTTVSFRIANTEDPTTDPAQDEKPLQLIELIKEIFRKIVEFLKSLC